MTDWVIQIIKSAGYTGIVILMFAENIFPPIPSEVIMPLSGYLVSRDDLQIAAVIACGTLGALMGALALYYLGYRLGAERLREWSDRYGRWFVLTRADIDKAQRWFDRHGVWTVFFLRLVPGLRSLISIPAGVSRMPFVSFLLFTIAGTAMWTALLTYIGYILGSEFTAVEKYIGPVGTAVVILMLAWYIWRVIKSSPGNQ